ncbi:S-layer homology domain-containing protein [Lysinibacillus sp. NPDC096418]|uniref:S-layer homology domain-containing protein n=1 Tax=Lysinibacillus sp. NPDC096418 TaxID=3364138 RepID=UPI003816180E
MNTKRFYQYAMAATLATSAIVIATPASAATTFPDVNSSTEEGKAIISLADRGIISGYPDGTFKPANAITRTQAAKILAGILELDTENVINPQFKDVKPSDENYGAIAALANAGIISGSNGYFNPTKNITRGQMSKMIVRGFDLELAEDTNIPFTDVVAGSEYEPYIQTLFANNITKGTTPTTFGTYSNVKRSQLASFVVRAENTKDSATVYAKKYNQDYIFASYGGINPAEDIFTWDEEQDWTDAISIQPLKEGTGKLVISGFTEETEEFVDVFFLVHVQTVNGKLQARLEEVDEADYLENMPLSLLEGDLNFVPTDVSIKTADGKVLASDKYAFEVKDKVTTLSIFENGEYTVTFTDGTLQQTMVAEVYSYDFVRMIDLYEVANQVTFTADDLVLEPKSVMFKDLSDEWDTDYKVPVKATIQDGVLIVTPVSEGPALLKVTGTNGETTYIYIEFMKFAGEWANIHEIDPDEYEDFID